MILCFEGRDFKLAVYSSHPAVTLKSYGGDNKSVEYITSPADGGAKEGA
jgi:hypothetical protein